MRWAIAVSMLACAAGCGSGGAAQVGSYRADDGPLAGEEAPLVSQTLPGDPAQPWPISIARGDGRYLLPWQDSDGLHVRLTGAAGELDLALGPGRFLGAAAQGSGFAVAISRGAQTVVRFLDGEGADVEVPAPLAGGSVPVSALASDGRSVLVAATVDGGDGPGRPPLVEGVLVGPSGAAPVALGARTAQPALFGDPGGFVVGGRWLISPSGLAGRAPGEQVAGVRLFSRDDPTGQQVTVDGAGWMPLPGPLDWAFGDERGLELGVGGMLLHVTRDLSITGTVAVPFAGGGAAWLRGVRGDRALWEMVVGSEHRFAVLDRATLTSRGPTVRLDAASRQVAVSVGDDDVLVAWLDGAGVCHYARLAE